MPRTTGESVTGNYSYPGTSQLADPISVRELANGVTQAALLDEDARLTEPVVLVDLDVPADSALLGQASVAARTAQRVLVGVRTREPLDEHWSDLLGALDVTLLQAGPQVPPRQCVALPDPASAGRMLVAAAAASPQATVALAQALHAGEGLDVLAALNLESFAYSTLLGGEEFRRWLASRSRRRVRPHGPEPAIIVERDAGVLWVTLNRPMRRNAYSRELRDALSETLLVPALDRAISQVVITGAGPSFCSGGDLDEFGTTPDIATAHFVRTDAGAAVRLHRIASRTEIRVHGACIGAGMELAAFADHVVAQPDTIFRLPEVSMGLIPGAGGTVSIPRRIGRWRALYLALSGSALDADMAARWGLVDEISSSATTSTHKGTRSSTPRLLPRLGTPAAPS